MIENEIWLGGNGKKNERSLDLARFVDPSCFLLKLVLFDKDRGESFIVEQMPYEYSFDPLEPPRFSIKNKK